jgi:hypothetical protein
VNIFLVRLGATMGVKVDNAAIEVQPVPPEIAETIADAVPEAAVAVALSATRAIAMTSTNEQVNLAAASPATRMAVAAKRPGLSRRPITARRCVRRSNA